MGASHRIPRWLQLIRFGSMGNDDSASRQMAFVVEEDLRYELNREAFPLVIKI